MTAPMHDAKTLAAELRAEGELLARQPELGEAFREGTCIFRAADALEGLAEAERERDRLRELNAVLMGDDEDKPRYTTKRLRQEIERHRQQDAVQLSALQEENTRLNGLIDGIDADRRGALDLCLVRNAEKAALQEEVGRLRGLDLSLIETALSHASFALDGVVSDDEEDEGKDGGSATCQWAKKTVDRALKQVRSALARTAGGKDD